MSAADLQELDCDLLILGAGPAGLSAAHAAHAQVGRLILADENPLPGGQIWRGGIKRWQDSRALKLWQSLQQADRARVQCLWQARLVFIQQGLALFETPAGAIRVSWRKLILCNGARELLLPFPGWTLPKVMGAGGLQALIKSGMPVQGQRVVIAGTGPLLLAAALSAQQAGAQLLCIAEHRNWLELARFLLQLMFIAPAKFLQAVKLRWQLRHIPYLSDARVVAALGCAQVEGVSLQQGQQQRQLSCDILACGFGLIGNLEVARHLQCELESGPGGLRVRFDHQQASSQKHIWVAGEICGIGGVEQALVQGRIAGLAASAQMLPDYLIRARQQHARFARLLTEVFQLDARLTQLSQDDTLVCRCEDVSMRELRDYPDWRSAKLQTRVGMGPCQGRVCGAACQVLFNWPAVDLRAPIFPAKVSTLCALANNNTSTCQEQGINKEDGV